MIYEMTPLKTPYSWCPYLRRQQWTMLRKQPLRLLIEFEAAKVEILWHLGTPSYHCFNRALRVICSLDSKNYTRKIYTGVPMSIDNLSICLWKSSRASFCWIKSKNGKQTKRQGTQSSLVIFTIQKGPCPRQIVLAEDVWYRRIMDSMMAHWTKFYICLAIG